MEKIFTTKTAQPVCHPELVSGSDPSAQVARCRNKSGMTCKTKGFTLAEVLITLGIIGVVASLTMPGLTAAYQKKVTVVRLQKFYSTMLQGINTKIAHDGAQDCSMFTSAYNPDEVLEFWNTNYAPYVKTIRVEKTLQGVEVDFLDGSGVYIAHVGTNASCGNTYFAFSPNAKLLANVRDKRLDFGSSYDCKNTFAFGTINNIGPVDRRDLWPTGTREELVQKIKNGNAMLCTKLIQYDGWEIKDDYPW